MYNIQYPKMTTSLVPSTKYTLYKIIEIQQHQPLDKQKLYLSFQINHSFITIFEIP